MDLLIGIFGFILYFLYDWNRVFAKKQWMSKFFLIGTLCQCYVGMRYLLVGVTGSHPNRFGWLLLAAVFLILLVYTLFFALPFDSTYCKKAENHKVCRTGLYGLCRHPGIWWFFGCFFCLGIAAGDLEVFMGGLFLSGLNLAYAWYQDKWIFPKEFVDYREYQKDVPFLIPVKRKQSGESL